MKSSCRSLGFAARLSTLASVLSTTLLACPATAQLSVAGIEPIPIPPGVPVYDTFAPRLGADGATAVGNYIALGTQPFVWRQSEGMKLLPGPMNTFVADVSADGLTAAGTVAALNGADRPVLWNLADDTHTIVDLPPTVFGAQTLALSNDGRVMGGAVRSISRADLTIPMRWVVGGAPELLTTSPAWISGGVSALNHDGSIAVGWAQRASDSEFRAFRWQEGAGMEDLGDVGKGAHARALDVDANGDVVVGSVQTGLLNGNAQVEAFRWTGAQGMRTLGTLGGSSSQAYGVNPGGSVVVGVSYSPGDYATVGFRWTQETGMQAIEQWLQSSGVDVAEGGPTVAVAYDVSADGRVVLGSLSDRSPFIARVVDPAPPDDEGKDQDDGDAVSPDKPASGNPEPSPNPSPAPSPNPGPGSGLINLAQFSTSLMASSQTVEQGMQDANMVMMGAHGHPMRGLISRGQQYVWTTGDWGRSDVSNSDHANGGAIEVGYARGFGQASMAKLAIGRTYSEQDTAYGGDIRTRGTYLMPEFISAVPGTPLYGTLSAYFNLGDADVRRGYLNAGVPVRSRGSTSADTWSAQARLDWLDAVKAGRVSVTPYAAVLYTKSHVSGYTEQYGGFPVRWDTRQQESTLARLGIDAVYELTGPVKLSGRMEAVHRFESRADNVTGEILGLNDFDLKGQRYKQNWMRFGAGIEAGIGKGTVSLYGNATTEAQSSRYWLSAGYRLPF